MDDDRTVTVSFTETKEYSLELDFSEMAKVLGVSKNRLTAIVEEGEDFEPSDTALSRMCRHADVQSEEVTVDDIFDS